MTEPDEVLEQFMTTTQLTVNSLHHDPAARIMTVATRPSPDSEKVSEQVFLISWGWCLSLDGDHFWVQTRDNRWHVYDAYDLPASFTRRFRQLMQKFLPD